MSIAYLVFTTHAKTFFFCLLVTKGGGVTNSFMLTMLV